MGSEKSKGFGADEIRLFNMLTGQMVKRDKGEFNRLRRADPTMLPFCVPSSSRRCGVASPDENGH
jgi:hypothetical protein